MRATSFRSLAILAAATLALSACASKQDPSVSSNTTGAGLGAYGDPNAAGAGAGIGAGNGAGIGQQPYNTLGGAGAGVGAGQAYNQTGAGIGSNGIGTSGIGTVGTNGGINGSTLGGVGQSGLYTTDTGLIDGGIISAAPQYTDGTIYTDTTTGNGGTFTQPYDATLFNDSGVVTNGGASTATNATPYTTYNDQSGGGTSLNGYSFPGDTGQQSYLTTQVGNRVLFETDSVILTADARETLRRQAAWLQLHPEHTTIVLEGHADERGTREYNLALGARRADAARAFLSSLGVSTSRLRTVSYGKERPLSLGSSANDWAKNRRVETVLGGGASF